MWLWLVVAVLAAIGEAVTYDLWLASISTSALITAGIAIFLPFVALQVAIFAIVALLGIAFVRPVVKHALGLDGSQRLEGPVTHPHLAGKRAVVTETVTVNGGQIRIGQGEFWTARTYEPDDTINPGETVEIVLVDGLTALIERVMPPQLEEDHSVPALNAPGTKGS